MKIKRTFCLILCFVLTLLLFQTPVSAEQEERDQSVTNGSHTLDASTPLLGTGRIISNCKSAVLYELSSETLLCAWNADERMYPASLVKIMTAYIAIDRGNLSDMVTVRDGALRSLPSDAVTVRLKAGEMISLEDLLYCMMVHSANDAAIVIAEHIAGSQNAFVKLMNEYAQDLGCTNTNFMNVHGIHHADQYSSARDIAKMLSAAMKNDVFREIFGTVRYTVGATNMSDSRSLVTGNHLMNVDSMQYYFDSRVTGGRTGVDYQGFRCIASSAEEYGMELISVVMGSVSVFDSKGAVVSFGGFLETTDLLDAGFETNRKRLIVSEYQVLRQVSIANGDCDLMLGVQESASTVLPYSVKLEDLSFRYTDYLQGISAPIQKGEKISHLQIWHGPLCLVQMDVYALNDVPVSYQKVQYHSIDNDGLLWWQIILIVLGAVLLIFVAVLVGMRTYNIQKRSGNRNNMYRKRRR